MNREEWEKLVDDGQWVENIYENSDAPQTEVIEPGLDCVRTGMYSDIGRRSSQQDSAIVSESYEYIENQRVIAILCDGMGGLAGGDLASGFCVKKMYEMYRDVSAGKDVPLFYNRMVEALDLCVKQMKTPAGDPLGAGTTLVSIIIENGELYWTSVGDSRIYIISDTGMMCLTRDHNYKMLLDEKVARGEITQRAADTNPQREALLSFIGQGGLKYVDISQQPFSLKGGDRLLLCSDGLYRTLQESEMADIVRRAGDDMEAAARNLVQRAVGKGKPKQDNTTAVVVKYLEMQ